MSSYMVADGTVNVIVSHLYFNPDLDWLKREFSEAIAGKTGDFCRDLGAALFALNICAVEERYGKGEAEKFRPLDYKFRLETVSTPQVYREIGTLKYQCCEGSVPETALYGLLTQLQAAVADSIIENFPRRTEEIIAELEASLYARCESCCKGLEHDDEHCGAPTARRLLVGSRTRKAA